MRALLLLPLLGCSANTLKIGDSGDLSGDSADNTGADSDDPGGDDSPVDSEPPAPEPDYSQYSGTLTFSYEVWGTTCEGELVNETAQAAEADEAAALADACPACDWFYRASLDKGEVCGWIDIAEDDWRGVVLGDSWAQIYRFDASDGGYDATLLDDGAGFDGWTITFDTTFSYWGVDVRVEGSYTYPEL